MTTVGRRPPRPASGGPGRTGAADLGQGMTVTIADVLVPWSFTVTTR